jgi:predicted transcriptional regulator
MKLSFAETQLILARRLKLLRGLSLPARRVHDALVDLCAQSSGSVLTVEQISGETRLSRRAVQLAAASLEDRSLINRFAEPGDPGCVYVVQDLQERYRALEQIKRGTKRSAPPCACPRPPLA